MRCCLAVVAAFIAASLALLLVFLVVAGLTVLPMSPDSLTSALRTSKYFFLWLPLVAFVVVLVVSYRAGRNVPLYMRIFGRKMKALVHSLPMKAQTVAESGEGGVWQSNRWRVTGGSEAKIEILENGAWTTVFHALFERATPGQWVPAKITRDAFTPGWIDSRTVHSEQAGGRAPHWEIVVYRPGPWEKELDELFDAAKQKNLAREQDRFGLT